MVTTSFEKLSVPFKSRSPTQNIVNLGGCLFAPLTFIIPSGYSIAPAILLFVSLCYAPVLFQRKNIKKVGILGFSLCLFFALYALLVVYHQDSVSTLDTPSRAILIVLVLALFMQFPPHFNALIYSFALGGILAGTYAIHDYYILEYDRAFAHVMPIQSGNISMIMGLISLQGTFFFFTRKQHLSASFCALGTFLGLTGSFLSLARGGWLALIIPVLFLFIHCKYNQTKTLKLYLGVCSLLIASSLAVSSFEIYQRSEKTVQNLQNYEKHQESPSSVGMRLELWQSHWQSFTEKPMLGWGLEGIRISQTQQWHDNSINDFIYEFNSHAHHQFLHALATQGLIGFIALLLLFLGPSYYFWRHLQDNHNEATYCSACFGLISIMAVAIFCLTQNFLSHHSGMLFYVTSLVFWAGGCQHGKQYT